MADRTFEEIVANNTTSKYHIYFAGYRHYFNHMSHGLGALHALGATNEKLEQFVDWYAKERELPEATKYIEEDQLIKASADELLGKKFDGFYKLVSHYESVIADYSSLGEAIGAEYTKLCPGLVTGAFHGSIHIGYGFLLDNQRIVAEGLAHLHSTYAPIGVDIGLVAQPLSSPGDLDLLGVLKLIKADKELTEFMLKEAEHINSTPALFDKNPTPFRQKTHPILQKKADVLLNYANRVKLPEFYDPKKAGEPEMNNKLMGWLVDSAITAYAMAAHKNDFFLLHGVTGTWCTKQFIPLISDPVTAHVIVRLFLIGLLVTYLAQYCPELHQKNVPVVEGGTEEVWKRLVEETLVGNKEEHVYKLVHVCWEMSKEHPNSSMESIYRGAVRNALENDHYFGEDDKDE